LQRICHIDPNPEPGRAKYAALVYLFKDERLGERVFIDGKTRHSFGRLEKSFATMLNKAIFS
jgi:hypothetical protein